MSEGVVVLGWRSGIWISGSLDFWADFRSSRRRMLFEWLRGGRREGFAGCDDDDDVIMMIAVDVDGWVEVAGATSRRKMLES